MGIVELLFIAIALSMDAFAVSVTNGMTILKLKVKHSVIIALAFGFSQLLMPILGYYLGMGFEAYINAFAHWIALILLSFIGGKMVIEGIKCKNENKCGIRCFSLKVIIVQAVATSVDALMVGVTFAAMGANLLFSVSMIGIITFLISLSGVYIGKKFGDMLKSKSEILGGIILIIIGLKIFIENLIS